MRCRRPWTGRCDRPPARPGRARRWCSRRPAPASTSSETSCTAARFSRSWCETSSEGRMAKKLAFDKVLFTTVVLLIFFGLVMVYSASSALARDHTPNHFLVKQAVAAGLGLTLMAWLMHVDYRRLRSPLALLVGVLFAPQLNATRRWFFVGGVSVQPSELAKLALIPFLAYQIEKKEERVNELSFLLPAGFFTALTAALILLEPDMGTAVLLGATFFLMIFLAGLRWRYIVAVLAFVPPLLGLLVMMEPYRRQR